MVPCHCTYCVDPKHTDPKYFKLSVLERAYQRGKPTVECDKDFIDVSIKALLEGVFEDGVSEREHKLEADLESGRELHIHNHIATTPSRASEAVEVESSQTTTSVAEPESNNKAWWQQAWFSGIVAGLLMALAVFGAITYWLGDYVNLPIAGGVATVVGVLTGYAIFALRSKRRYWAASLSTLTFIFVNNSSALAGKFGFTPTVNGQKANLFLEFGGSLEAIITLGFMGLIALWSYLDFKQSH